MSLGLSYDGYTTVLTGVRHRRVCCLLDPFHAEAALNNNNNNIGIGLILL